MATTEKAATSTATPALKSYDGQDNKNDADLSSSRAKRIAKRRSDMPEVYRGIYDRAVSGKSLRAAVNAFCLECVYWQRKEVRLCTSLPCPLWPYRPYQGTSKTPAEGQDFAPESTNENETYAE